MENFLEPVILYVFLAVVGILFRVIIDDSGETSGVSLKDRCYMHKTILYVQV